MRAPFKSMSAMWKIDRISSFLGLAVLAACVSVGSPGRLVAVASAQQADGVSVLMRGRARGDLPRPDVTGLGTLNFATAIDYPPFNYADEAGNLTGLNVDLARAICDELSVRCIIEGMGWDDLVPSLANGKSHALIASIAINKSSRQKMLFTEIYYRTPARFIMRQGSVPSDFSAQWLAGKQVAVRKGTAHEAYLRAFFPNARIRPFEDAGLAREALRTGLVDAYFGDAVNAMFWIAGTSSKNCCLFAGGPYTEAKFFGDGVGIAVKKDNYKLVRILNYALERLRRRGVYRDLLLRHFPAGNF